MSGKIYLIKDDNELVEMEEKDYEKELILQKLIADHPDLLAGEQMDSENPRRWLLVRKEMGIPFEEEGAKSLSLDHLFLDHEGIPTLVEVKRSSDTRSRREVVAQMLDYAANAVVYVPANEIREKIESEYDLALEEDFLDKGMDIEKFWQSVKTNLQAGKIRMVFVADKIPKELQRIIEFMNEQMSPAEVLAVEIKQYVNSSNEIKTLVPRVLGQTAEAQIKKQNGSKEPILNKHIFFKNLDQYGKEFFEDLFDFSKKNNLIIRWGTKGFSLNLEVDGNFVSFLQGYSSMSKFGQSIISTVGRIEKKVKNGNKINEEYMEVLKLENFNPVGAGFKLELDHKLEKNQLKEFKKILINVISDIKSNGLK